MHYLESLAFHNLKVSHAGRRILNPVQLKHPGENVVIKAGRTARTDAPLGRQREKMVKLPYDGRIPTSSSTSSGVKPKALSSASVGPGVYIAAATCLSFFADTHQLFGVSQTDAVERRG
jgi:hypothetical protein